MANKLANKSNVSLFARFYVFYQHLYLRWAIFLSNTGVGEKGGGCCDTCPYFICLKIDFTFVHNYGLNGVEKLKMPERSTASIFLIL